MDLSPISSTFDERFPEIDGSLDDLYSEFRRPDPNIPVRLFHFTNTCGLVGILTSQNLRASHADFLNDSSEPAYALQVLEASLKKVASSLHSGSAVSRVLSGFWDWAIHCYHSQGPHLYVFCLSEHDDLLSQWRGYGSLGDGYALGFTGRQLSEGLHPERGQYLVKVIYDKSEQQRESERVFQQILAAAGEFEAKIGSIDAQRLGDAAAARFDYRLRSALLSEVIRLRAKFKGRAFQEEGEWRLCQFVHPRVRQPEVQFHPGERVIRPYVELSLEKSLEERPLPIEQVTIGPTLDPDLAKRSLGLLLEKCGYGTARIRVSDVPFRG